MICVTNAALPITAPSTCCTETSSLPVEDTSAKGTKFHFAMNVTDMERSIAFYRILFGVDPAKHHPDYAKFELSQPPLVFSLVPNTPSSGGSVSHFGFPVGSSADVQAAATRLSAAGLDAVCQEGTVCGYARQDKVWVADPDRNFWEIYVIHEDVNPETVRSAFDGVAPTPKPVTSGDSLPVVEPGFVLWEHRVLMPFSGRIPYDNEAVDEVRLEGSFNDRFNTDERLQLLNEALRVLRPSGRLTVHGLVADGPLEELPPLPGVAALVQRVPQESEPMREMTAAGFEAIRVTKLSAAPVFRHGTVGMREIKWEARKPAVANEGELARIVIYKGPFPVALDEDGQAFRRGQRTQVSEQSWDRLAAGAAASQFVFLNDPCAAECGCE